MLKISVDGELLPWTEFRNRRDKLAVSDLRGLKFTVALPHSTERKRPTLTDEQYKRLLATHRSGELSEMRAEWQEFKRESVWLVNALFAAGGVGACAFFVTGSFDFAPRVAVTAIASISMFFIEVILYIILVER